MLMDSVMMITCNDRYLFHVFRVEFEILPAISIQPPNVGLYLSQCDGVIHTSSVLFRVYLKEEMICTDAIESIHVSNRNILQRGFAPVIFNNQI